MKEEIKFIGCDEQGEEQEYALRFEDDCLAVVDCVTGEEICGGDWSANFRPMFERALSIWPDAADEA